MTSNISPNAVIASGVEIGDNCSIGPFTIIHKGSRIGANTTIGSFCEIGVESSLANNQEAVIGDNCLIRSHTTIYNGTKIEKGFITGHNVVIRENSTIGQNVRIGTFSDIQGDCKIGNYSRLHSSVHIGKFSEVGEFVWIFPYVVLTNDPCPPSKNLIGSTIQDFAVIATMSTLLPGTVIGFGSLIGANSLVQQNVPIEVLALGSPARIIKPVNQILRKIDGFPGYPWFQNYRDGYPEELSIIYANLRLKYSGSA